MYCLYCEILDTTDVQAIRVAATGINNQVRMKCEFIPGSDAEGCIVILVSGGEVDNATFNFTRESNTSIIAETRLELQSPLHCYSQVYVLEIEVDGSVGTLPVQGELDHTGVNTAESCLPIDIPSITKSECRLL